MKIRLNYLDVLSGIAILGVVLIHAHAYYMIEGAKFYRDGLLWAKFPFSDNILDFIITYSVCLFLFIAGYKYEINSQINDTMSYIIYVKKRFVKIIIPFWVISFFLLSYNYIFNKIGNMNIKQLVIIFFNTLIGKTPVVYTYWFIPMFIFVSLSYPILRKLIKNNYLRIIFLIAIKVLFDIFLFAQYFPWPLNFLSFIIYFEIGTICYRNINHLLSKKLFIPILSIFMFLFVLRNINTSIEVDGKLLELLKFIGPITSFYVAYYLDRFRISKFLSWLGYYSWIIYLYHEPFFVYTTFKYLKLLKIDTYFFSTFISAAAGILASILFYRLINLLSKNGASIAKK